MPLKLDGLYPLRFSMEAQEIDRYKFEYKVHDVTFSIFFFIDCEPAILLFGLKGGRFSFELEVNNYCIDCDLEHDEYIKLCEVLGLKYDPDNKFSPWNFFSEFNVNIPRRANKKQRAKPHEIAKYRKVTEEADKVHFIGWRDNYKWDTSVRAENLEKTRELLSEKAYRRCKQKNISSCWSANEKFAIEVTLP